MDTKKCNGPCGLVKETKEFGFRTYATGHVGVRSRCIACRNIERDEWRHKNFAHDTARNNAYNKRNAERIQGHKLRKYWPGTPENALAQWKALLASQDGACAICKKVRKKMHVDHCHKGGQVRGILCNQCNRAIGLFEDRPERLYAAIFYLAAHTKETV